jgi:arsenate reductase
MKKNKKKVLFLCTYNSARSQIAEGLLDTYFRYKYESFSAGIKPTSINPYAVEVMKEIGIDISNHYSKSINEFKDKKFDYVVTVCNNAKESCPFFPGKKIIHKGFDDPTKIVGDIEEILNYFKKIRDEIKDWIFKNFGNIKYEYK